MPTIGAAVTEETKGAFESAARKRRTTSSRLSASLIHDFLLQEADKASATGQESAQPNPFGCSGYDETKTKQVAVRLEPYYYAELERLAGDKQWPRSTYLANLFHAHADKRPVFCSTEIHALRQVARHMSQTGRALNHLVGHLRNAPEDIHIVSCAEFKLLEVLLESEVKAVKALIKANLVGWGVCGENT